MSPAVCESAGIERLIGPARQAPVSRLEAAVSKCQSGTVTLTWSADAGAVIRDTASLTMPSFGGNCVLTEDHYGRLDGR